MNDKFVNIGIPNIFKHFMSVNEKKQKRCSTHDVFDDQLLPSPKELEQIFKAILIRINDRK